MAPRTLTGRLARKLVMSFVATVVTGAAGYAGKKAPQLIEDKLMPRLRDTAPERTRDHAEERGHRTKERPLSQTQRDARRRQRAAHREARRTGSGAKED